MPSDAVIRETGCDQVTLKHLDLSSLASVRKFAAEILAEESRLDILVNNAGVGLWTKVIKIGRASCRERV